MLGKFSAKFSKGWKSAPFLAVDVALKLSIVNFNATGRGGRTRAFMHNLSLLRRKDAGGVFLSWLLYD
jgi:hypothetical protein